MVKVSGQGVGAGIQRPQDAKEPWEKLDYYWNRWGQLKTERSSWDSHARELSQFLLPRSSRFTTSETNRGEPKHNRIYDNTGLRAVRVLGAGMMSGMTSPARPWFRLKHPDDDLMKYEPVKVWCSQVTRLMLDVFAKSNFYRMMHQIYTELGVYGTAAAVLMPNFDTVIHGTPFTFGEYAIALDPNGKGDTLYREMRMSAINMIRQFGYDNVSMGVRNAYDRGNLSNQFDVIHAIEPRLTLDSSKMDSKNMPWRSCYFEQGGTKDKVLSESGFKKFIGLTPRWQVTSMDTYGESPGMEALGDVKQLQHEQFRKAQGIDYMTKPPVGLPSSMKGQEVNTLPGGVTFFDAANAQSGQRQLFDVKLNLEHLLADIQDIRGRVNSAFYADLFMMISGMDNTGEKMTATEVAERHEEKLLMLGPVLERLHNELLDPAVDMTFDRLLEAGVLPPAPPELHGQQIDVELISMLAQAQRAVQTNGMDRFLMGVASIGQLGKPEVADKIDGDAMVEAYADSLGVDPALLVDDAKVQAARQARAQAQQQAADAAQKSDAAASVAQLGKVPTQGGASNAGADAIGMFSGYNNPGAERVLPGT